MIIFIANQILGKEIATGGDVLFIEILKRCHVTKMVIAPKEVHKTIAKIDETAQLIDCKFPWNGKSASTIIGGIYVMIAYILRGIYTYKFLKKNLQNNETIYLTGDFISNTLPIYLLIKINRKKINCIGNFYHRNPPPNNREGNNKIISFFSRLIQGIGLKIYNQCVQTTFVLSELGKLELLSTGYSGNIVISGAAINQKKINNGIIKNENRIIYLGRINKTKGAFDLLYILSHLNKKNIEYECLLIGSGTNEDVEELIKISKELSIENNISILGFLDEKSKFEILSSAKILAFPSKEEGYGITILEALQARLRIVAYDIPVISHLYSKSKWVHTVKLNDKVAFANKLYELLKIRHEGNCDLDMLIPTWDDVYKIQSEYL